MMRWLWLVLVCAPAYGAQFSFGALGDTPYSKDEEPQFVSMIAEMNHEPLAFALHVGDFKNSSSDCSDALFMQRLEAFQLSHHAFFYTPGDNEWTDCARPRWARKDPLERLNKLRQIFFARDQSLGQQPLPVERQVARGFPENLRWIVQDAIFATLNIPGPDNNARIPAESKPRTAANLRWMRETFRIARERKFPAVVLATQADLFTGNGGFSEILAALAREAQRYTGEVLIVHGDTHWFRYDQPLVDPASGRTISNVTRIEVYGSPFVRWVRVTITTEAGKARFEVEPGGLLATRER